MQQDEAYFFFGLPGAGKGTQTELFLAELTKENKPFLMVNIGGVLRDHMAKHETYVSKRAGDASSAGQLLPTAFAVCAWGNLLTAEYTPEKVLIFDGVRKLPEWHLIMEMLQFLGIKKIVFIYLDIPSEESAKRLLVRGRVDDTPEAIKVRQEKFYDEKNGTMASVNFAKNNPFIRFIQIDGLGTPEEVRERIVKQLHNV